MQTICNFNHFRFASPYVVSVVCLLASLATCRFAPGEEIDFNRDIRPLLSEHCFTCHGPDAQKRQSGLRLDERASAIVPAESKQIAIVPNHPEKSELWNRLVTKDSSLRMPPAETGKSLTEEHIAKIQQWIKEGANYSGHWSFTTPKRPPVPAAVTFSSASTSEKDQVANNLKVSDNPVDRFIQARLKREGLIPSPPADKVTQLRRVTLDLTGLPPTPEEVDAYLSDAWPQAYERAVDRLLASPRYGERMAVNWLDYARYADSNGYQSDGSRDIWAWREWVIQAYNRNLPFDQFTIEQLAGDMLPGATRDQIVATGFNRNHRLNGEGGRIEAEWFAETVIDRVETTGLTWLGLTFNCCRCHDHKYDPISQKEFYGLFAFFNSVEESGVLAPSGKNGENTPPLLTIGSEEQFEKLNQLKQDLSKAESAAKALQQDAKALVSQWEQSRNASKNESSENAPINPWQVAECKEVRSKGGATVTRLEDSSYLFGGKNPGNDQYTISIPMETEMRLTGVLVETLTDASLPNQSLGRGSNGNFVLTSVTAKTIPPKRAKATPIKFQRAEADYEQSGWLAASLLEPKPKDKTQRHGWAVDGNAPDKRIGRHLLLAVDKPVRLPAGSTLEIQLDHASPYPDHNVGRLRISLSTEPVENLVLKNEGLPKDIQESLDTAPDKRNEDQWKRLIEYVRSSVPGPLREADEKTKAAKKAVTDFEETLPTTMVMRERAEARDAFVLLRGQYDQPGDKVARQLPAVLPPLADGAPVNRLGLAQWIVDKRNPLTARVWVNREWERFFGLGIVRTSENLGSQSEYPFHPELLDWLACEFMEPTSAMQPSGQAVTAWDMKALQKLIVMSDTYRQSSRVASPELLARDPENRLLARGPRFRLAGELIRDSALFVSGLLVEKIGGPSVRPYMPAGVWDETSKYGNLRNYQMDSGAGQYRRTLYTIWKRTAAPPTMLLFDAPNREICTVKRSRTNTPLQALSL